MKEKQDPLVMYIHDGTKLAVDEELNLTIDGEEPTPEEVVDFLITFAEDSMKGPEEPKTALVDLVKEAAIKEEGKKEKENA